MRLKMIILTTIAFLFIAFLLYILYGNGYDEKDRVFTDVENSLFSPYKAGMTLHFVSNKGNRDTLVIDSIVQYEDHSRAYLPGAKAHQTKQIEVKSPANKDNIPLLTVTKYPHAKKTVLTMYFTLKDFYSEFTLKEGIFQTEPLTLGNLTLQRYLKINNSKVTEIMPDTALSAVYWSAEKGMIAYQNYVGEIWVLE
jgi:hypothetical protein